VIIVFLHKLKGSVVVDSNDKIFGGLKFRNLAKAQIKRIVHRVVDLNKGWNRGMLNTKESLIIQIQLGSRVAIQNIYLG
jgi:hypothetical protein